MWSEIDIGGMKDIGLARPIPLRIGCRLIMMERCSLMATGTATTAGGSTTIIGTATMTAISIVNTIDGSSRMTNNQLLRGGIECR